MIDEGDIKVLNLLRKDARIKLARVVEELRMPQSTASGKVSRLGGKAIRKFTAHIDFNHVGFPVREILLFSAKERHKIEAFLKENHNVNNLYRVTPHSDYFVEALFRDLNESNFFHERLEKLNCRGIETYFIIEDLKVEGGMLSF